MTRMTNNNSKFSAAEEIIANRAGREGILLSEGILFSAKGEAKNRHFSRSFSFAGLVCAAAGGMTGSMYEDYK